jgi:KDO2-lipid IV(A) lauroyltransferase
VQALIIRILLRIFSWLPLSVNHALGSAIGWLFYQVPSKAAKVTETNLRLCMPELSESERTRLKKASLMEAGKAMTELGALWHWKPEQLRKLIKKVSGEEILRTALKKGNGVIGLTPHLGTWELTSLYYADKVPLTCLYRPPRMTGLDKLMHGARERLGAKLVPTSQAGVKALYRALNNKEIAGILPDQVPRDGQGIFAPFFGVPAETIVLINRLAIKTGAPVIFIYAERLPRGTGYHMHFMEAPAGIDDSDSMIAATALNKGIENCVRQLPEQYQWSYKRFRTRPVGEKPVY